MDFRGPSWAPLRLNGGFIFLVSYFILFLEDKAVPFQNGEKHKSLWLSKKVSPGACHWFHPWRLPYLVGRKPRRLAFQLIPPQSETCLGVSLGPVGQENCWKALDTSDCWCEDSGGKQNKTKPSLLDWFSLKDFKMTKVPVTKRCRVPLPPGPLFPFLPPALLTQVSLLSLCESCRVFKTKNRN